MELALTRLQSSCLCLNLDDESPSSRKECAELLLTGGLKSGENRWFDKSIQISVCKNGKAGLLAEHAMMDGTTMVDFVNFISKEKFGNSSYNSVTLAAGAGGVIDIFAEAMQHMDWEATNVLVRQGTVSVVVFSQVFLGYKFWSLPLPDTATFSFQQVVGNQCLRVQNFEDYGSTFIKKVARFPPDAYVQMAMQLATYRTFGEQVGTYESTQVRSFLWVLLSALNFATHKHLSDSILFLPDMVELKWPGQFRLPARLLSRLWGKQLMLTSPTPPCWPRNWFCWPKQ